MPPRNVEISAVAFTGSRAALVGNSNKRCTDLTCCCVLLLCLVGLLVLGGFGIRDGNPAVLERLVWGRDFKGRLCGKDSQVKNFSFAYFTLEEGSNPVEKWTEEARGRLRVVCTKTCPLAAFDTGVTLREPNACPDDMYPKWCSWYGGRTLHLANYCIDPEVFNSAFPWEQLLQDLRVSQLHIFLVVPVAFVIGFIFLGFVEGCGACFVWFVLLVLVGALVGCGFWLHDDVAVESYTKITSVDKKTEKYIAFACWAVAGLIVLLAMCYNRTLRKISAVTSATSRFLKDVPSQMLQPAMFGCAQALIGIGWLFLLFGVLSLDAEEGSSETCAANRDIFCVHWNQELSQVSLLSFMAVMILWILNYLHALSHFGTAYAVGEWYFTKVDIDTGVKRPSAGGRLTVEGITMGVANHSGSLAYGALCISLCRLVKLLLFWVVKDEETHSNNGCIKCVLRCSNCLADCLARYVNFVSEHAYVEMALTGGGFCHSAKAALALSMKRPHLFTLVSGVACAVRLMGTSIIILVGTCVVQLSLLAWRPEGLQSMLVPIVAAAALCLFVGEVAMHPFSAAARATLHCYCLDAEVARSTGSAPEHTPPPMLRFVEAHDGSAN